MNSETTKSTCTVFRCFVSRYMLRVSMKMRLLVIAYVSYVCFFAPTTSIVWVFDRKFSTSVMRSVVSVIKMCIEKFMYCCSRANDAE